MLFSRSKLSFYNPSWKELYESADNWPDDLIEVNDDDWVSFTSSPPNGKILCADKKGLPCWGDLPEPTQNELTANAQAVKDSCLSLAYSEVEPLQYAVDLGIETESEKVRLHAWKRYAVLVNRIDPSRSPDIEWPEKPLI